MSSETFPSIPWSCCSFIQLYRRLLLDSVHHMRQVLRCPPYNQAPILDLSSWAGLLWREWAMDPEQVRAGPGESKQQPRAFQLGSFLPAFLFSRPFTRGRSPCTRAMLCFKILSLLAPKPEYFGPSWTLLPIITASTLPPHPRPTTAVSSIHLADSSIHLLTSPHHSFAFDSLVLTLPSSGSVSCRQYLHLCDPAAIRQGRFWR